MSIKVYWTTCRLCSLLYNIVEFETQFLYDDFLVTPFFSSVNFQFSKYVCVPHLINTTNTKQIHFFYIKHFLSFLYFNWWLGIDSYQLLKEYNRSVCVEGWWVTFWGWLIRDMLHRAVARYPAKFMGESGLCDIFIISLFYQKIINMSINFCTPS